MIPITVTTTATIAAAATSIARFRCFLAGHKLQSGQHQMCLGEINGGNGGDKFFDATRMLPQSGGQRFLKLFVRFCRLFQRPRVTWVYGCVC